MSEPLGAKGRKFLDEGIWATVAVDGERFHVKMTTDDFKKAVSGGMFEAWHACFIQDRKLTYLPAATGTSEPWYLSGSRCAYFAVVHPQVANDLDANISQLLSVITTATPMDAEREKRKKKIELV